MRTKTKYITSTKKPQEKTKKQQDKATIILLYDTEAYRMKSYGPLPLVLIGEKRLLDLQIEAIKDCFDNFEIILCTVNGSEKLHKFIKNNYKNINIRIVENQLYNQTNCCESIRLCLNNTFNNKVLICSGDLLLNKQAISLIKTDKTCILFEDSPSENLEIGLNINQNNDAEHFSFGATNIWSEVIFISSEQEIDIIKKLIMLPNNKNKFIFEILNDFIKLKNSIFCIRNKNVINKINNIKTYHKVKDGI